MVMTSSQLHLANASMQNADSSVPNNANVSEPTSKHAVQSPVRAEDIFDRTKLYFAWKILDDFAQRFLDDRPGASYVYRMPSSGPQEPVSFSTIDGKDIPRMMLRPGLTFFHINEVTISKKAFQNGRTTFGLFARVVRAGCGSDEYWPKDFQCFQLEDLFGGQPYLSGITFFEETESPLRRQPSLFVQAGENEDKCFCLCQYVNEECHVPGTRLGWGVYIHEILPVTWETIRIVHTQVGGPRRRPWEPTYRY